MNRIVSQVVAALLFCLATAVAHAGQWIELETPSFRALSEVGEGRSRVVLRELEIFRAALPQMINIPDVPSKVPTRIFLLDASTFRKASEGLGNAVGVFSSRPFSNDILIDASLGTVESFFILYHEYVHFYLSSHGSNTLPAFYEEGFAQLAQYFLPNGRDKYEFGFFPRELLKDARRKSMPLARVLAIHHESEEYRDHRQQPAFYARSLLLVHYCIVENQAYRKSLARFVARLANGEPREEAFLAEFGMTIDAFDEELDAYASRIPRRNLVLRADSIPKPPPARVSLVPRDEARLRIAEMLLRVERDKTVADWIPAELVAAKRPSALAALALSHERAGRQAEADKLIESIASAPAVDAESLTRAGFVLVGRIQRADDHGNPAHQASLQKARQLFRSALTIDPTHLEAAYGYGLVSVLSPAPLEDARPIVEAAAARFPESGELLMVYAMHVAHGGDEAEARRLLAIAACRANDRKTRELAARDLGQVTCMRAD